MQFRMPQVQAAVLLRREASQDWMLVQGILGLQPSDAVFQATEGVFDRDSIRRQEDGRPVRQLEARPHRPDERAIAERLDEQADPQRRAESESVEGAVDCAGEVVEDLPSGPLTDRGIRPFDSGAGVGEHVIKCQEAQGASLRCGGGCCHQVRVAGLAGAARVTARDG